MARRIDVASSVKSDMRGIPKSDLLKIQAEIAALAEEPIPSGAVVYQRGICGMPAWRIRVGHYRVIYMFDEERVWIDRVASRADVYR